MVSSHILRRCRKCLLKATTLEELEDFVDNKQCKYGKDNLCVTCNVEYAYRWNQDNKEKRNKRNRDRALLIKFEAIEYKGGECVKCGIKATHTNTCIFDFHHEDPSLKDYEPSNILKNKGLSKETKEELDKCSLVCSNCHRLIHSKL